MNDQAASVSDIVFAIKNTLEVEYRDVSVLGEISNLSHSSAGHYYFTLSDSQSSLSCALFKTDAMRNPMIRRIKNGDKALVRGPISVYGKRGTFQLLAKRIVPHGGGDLRAQFELLKSKLQTQGYFDIDIKKPIPFLPQKIAVITALKGAALQDFLNVMKRRSLWYDIVILPAVVQGESAAGSVIKALNYVEEKECFDCVVITRGGGSMEDLWAFNDEKLVQRVYDCITPVISAVGHQVDFSLLDFVADQRCETPSTAAELLSQEQTLLKSRLYIVAQSLRQSIVDFKVEVEKRLQRINPLNTLHLLKERFHTVEMTLSHLNIFESQRALKINEHYQYIDELADRLTKAMSLKLEKSGDRLSTSKKLLYSLNPKSVLSRGYSYLKDEKGGIVSSKKIAIKLKTGSKLTVRFHDGEAKVETL